MRQNTRSLWQLGNQDAKSSYQYKSDYFKWMVKETFWILLPLHSNLILSFYQNMVLLCSREQIIIKETTV